MSGLTRYIWHVTLNTGHVAKQRREDVGEAAVAGLSDLLDGILQGARLPVPGCDGYLVNASHAGHGLIATVWRGPWTNPVPILTTATALKSRSAPELWHLMHDQSTVPLMTDRETPPRTPWQADRIEVGGMMYADALTWTGDFSRSLAWSWAAYRNG